VGTGAAVTSTPRGYFQAGGARLTALMRLRQETVLQLITKEIKPTKRSKALIETVPQPPGRHTRPEDSGVPRSRLMPGVFSIKVLTVLLRKPKTAFIVVGVISFIVAFLLIHLANPNPPRHETFFTRFGDESQTTVMALLIALLIVPLAVVLVLRKMFVALIAVARESAEKGRAPVLPFLAETVDQMAEQLNELHGQGIELESYQVASWVRRCFQTAGPATRYVGTDSHVPSDYEAVYTDYLKAQRQFLSKSTLSNHARIMVVDTGKLRSDKFGSESYSTFVGWHDRNKVDLLQLDPEANKAYVANPENHVLELVDTDIGFWEDKYVLLFKPIQKLGERERTLLRIAYQGEPLYEECKRYVEWIEREATSIGEELPFYPDALSAGWEEFCDPPERIKHTMPFIEGVIAQVPREKSDVRIFDAATGIGIETTELIKEGFFVAANEIESSLRLAADAYAQRHHVRIPPARFYRSDWLHLDEQHDAAAYDVVLVLGNSLCHLEGVEQLSTAIHQFTKLLRLGGALICDERNFEYILDDWDEIARDPWNEFRFNRRKPEERVMYYGDTILGAPVRRTEQGRVIFEYARAARDDNDVITPDRDRVLGTLSMFPFAKGQMLKVLRDESGLGDVEILSDLVRSHDLSRSADFYTYAAFRV
jgi:SAM-dependent methyltransferase